MKNKTTIKVYKLKPLKNVNAPDSQLLKDNILKHGVEKFKDERCISY